MAEFEPNLLALSHIGHESEHSTNGAAGIPKWRRRQADVDRCPILPVSHDCQIAEGFVVHESFSQVSVLVRLFWRHSRERIPQHFVFVPSEDVFRSRIPELAESI